MEKVIPLHALILITQNDPWSSMSYFPKHEIITIEAITNDLVGQTQRPDLLNIVIAEMQHRILLKLSLGERVIIASTIFLSREYRLMFGHLAVAQGASVIYLLDSSEKDANLLIGDAIAKVFRLGDKLHIVQPLPDEPLAVLRSRFRGITVIGDVHGSTKLMQDALLWCRSRNHFAWFLGDVVDCGEETLDALIMAYTIVMRGEGAFILGNHERKIARWISHQDTNKMMKVSDGNRVTIDALRILSKERRIQWCGKFRSLLGRATLMSHVGDVTFVHAAVHPNVWNSLMSNQQAIEDYALYGESDPTIRRFTLSYDWVNEVPNGKMVFVGHDVRSTIAPLAVTGRKGGKVIFLDTGSGKGGALSTADLRFTSQGGLHLENFNRH